jgi:hypothetical protein
VKMKVANNLTGIVAISIYWTRDFIDGNPMSNTLYLTKPSRRDFIVIAVLDKSWLQLDYLAVAISWLIGCHFAWQGLR